MKERLRRFVGLCAACMALVIVLCPCTAALADDTYVHGYFRYTVADDSVTITGYAGTEQTVTIPAMIAGNPVNTIATGAFSDAKETVAVYLPDTVTSVEEGAFSTGQAIVFAEAAKPADAGTDLGSDGSGESDTSTTDDGSSTADDGSSDDDESKQGGDAPGQGSDNTPGSDDTSGDTSSGDATSGGESASDPSGSKPSSPVPGVPGIRTDDGSLVAVDGEGHLVLVDADGAERVLDDSRTYERTTRDDGTVAIIGDDGTEVVVADGSKVSFSDAAGRQVVVDAAAGTTTVSNEDDSFSNEEIEIGDDSEGSATEAKSDDSDKGAGEQSAAGSAVVPIVLGVVAVAAVGVVMWKRKKK